MDGEEERLSRSFEEGIGELPGELADALRRYVIEARRA